MHLSKIKKQRWIKDVFIVLSAQFRMEEPRRAQLNGIEATLPSTAQPFRSWAKGNQHNRVRGPGGHLKGNTISSFVLSWCCVHTNFHSQIFFTPVVTGTLHPISKTKQNEKQKLKLSNESFYLSLIMIIIIIITIIIIIAITGKHYIPILSHRSVRATIVILLCVSLFSICL